jgi:hypothetical protein
MTYSEKQYAAKWVDDYLDLYNMAVRIGDAEWQQQILRTLQAKDKHIQLEIVSGIKVDLWLKFDSINRKMVLLYEQLRNNNYSEPEKRHLLEQVWEFKLQRIMIASKLKEYHLSS